MPIFQFIAMDSAGNEKKGRIEAETEKEVGATLKENGLYSTSIKQIKSKGEGKKGRFAGAEVVREFKRLVLDEVKAYYEKEGKKGDIPEKAQGRNLVRAHGYIGTDDEAYNHTTVAVGTVVETITRLKEKNKKNNLGVPDKVYEQYLKAILAAYKIRRYRFESVEQFRDHFVFDIELLHADRNKKMAMADAPAITKLIEAVEARMLKRFKGNHKASRKPKDVLKGKGSKLITDEVLKSVLRPRDAKGRFIKVTKAKSTEKDSKKRETDQGTTTLLKGKESKKKVSGKRAKPLRVQKRQAKTQESAIKLRALLDRMLPQVVASKMQSPRLVYRTGRFAQSVRTENVAIGPRGGIHIDYTYMKYPYQTFEPGFAQGSSYRDPRSLIKESIREIAITLVGEKFMTIRRV